MSDSTHALAGGTVVTDEERILLVRQRDRWSLPKGGVEPGESFAETAVRETREETGLRVNVRDVAFVTEFYGAHTDHSLQVYYAGRAVGGELRTDDPDGEVVDARFVRVKRLRRYLKFRPVVVPLERWLREGAQQYRSFDLESESIEVESRT